MIKFAGGLATCFFIRAMFVLVFYLMLLVAKGEKGMQENMGKETENNNEQKKNNIINENVSQNSFWKWFFTPSIFVAIFTTIVGPVIFYLVNKDIEDRKIKSNKKIEEYKIKSLEITEKRKIQKALIEKIMDYTKNDNESYFKVNLLLDIIKDNESDIGIKYESFKKRIDESQESYISTLKKEKENAQREIKKVKENIKLLNNNLLSKSKKEKQLKRKINKILTSKKISINELKKMKKIMEKRNKILEEKDTLLKDREKLIGDKIKLIKNNELKIKNQKEAIILLNKKIKDSEKNKNELISEIGILKKGYAETIEKNKDLKSLKKALLLKNKKLKKEYSDLLKRCPQPNTPKKNNQITPPKENSNLDTNIPTEGDDSVENDSSTEKEKNIQKEAK